MVMLIKVYFDTVQDFATRSLNMSEESPIQMLRRRDLVEVEEEETEEEELRQFQLRRTWESRYCYPRLTPSPSTTPHTYPKFLFQT